MQTRRPSPGPFYSTKVDLVSLPREVRLFWLVAGTLIALCIGSELFCRFILHKTGVYTWPTMPFYDDVDFRCFMPRFEHFHSAQFFSTDAVVRPRFGYPASAALLYAFFYRSPFPTVTFFVVSLGLLALLGLCLGRAMQAEGIGGRTLGWFLPATIVFSYPFWFEFLLGNMEICIFFMVAFGVLAFLRGWGYSAAALFGIAGSMKIFPLIYFGLLLARRQYRQVVYGLAIMGVVSVFGLWAVCPDLAVSNRGICAGLALFHDYFLLHFHPAEMGFDHSLFGLIKQFTPGLRSPETLARMLSLYMPVVALGGTLLYFLRIRRLPVLNQILCLCVASILLPPLSHDYTLIHLYLPWGLFLVLSLQAARDRRYLPGLAAVFVCFAILMSPQTEFIHLGQSYGGQVKSLTLLVLFALGLGFQFTTELDLPAMAESVREPELASAD